MRFQLREQLDGSVHVAAADPQVLAGRQLHEHGSLLRDDGQALAGPDVQRVVGVAVEKAHLAAERRQLPGHGAQRRRLAGTVGPEERDDLAGVHVQVEAVDDLDVAVAGPQPGGLEQRGHVVATVRLALGAAEVGLDDAGVAAHLAGRALGDLPPEVEDDDAVAGLQQQRHVVLDDEDADAPSARRRPDRRAELGGLPAVEAGRRLVEQQHGRLGDERTGDADETGHAVRQRRRPLVEHVAEPELLDELVDERCARPPPRPDEVDEIPPGRLVVGGDEQVVAHRQLLEQLDRLPRADDPGPGPPLDRPPVDGGAVEADRARSPPA